ncbi:MAG: ABC transporter substrate-binding protein [Ruminococcaceae bacterium]|nr:ABC transporter substrate-binding protein [Oscillospiraceae bacterium]
MKLRFLSLLLAILTLTAALSACGEKNEAGDAAANVQADAGTNNDEQPAEAPAEENYDGKLVLDHSMELKYAKFFSVDYYKGGYKIAKVQNTPDDYSVMLIVPEGMSVPEDAPENAIILKQPVKNILVSSTPVTSLINAVGALDAISLTTYDVDSWYIDDVKNALTDNRLTYIGDYKTPDYEKIVAQGTTFAFFSTMLTDDVRDQLTTLGVDVVLDQSSQEDHPLGRVEWAKLYGAIFNKEEAAEEVFNTQDKYVEDLLKAEKTGKSVAMFYITSKGVLYARNADDYMAKMLEIAGGEYALSDVGVGETGTAKMELEAFYDKAKDADYIIYIWSMGGKPETMDAFLERAAILSDMKAVQDGNVWCTTPDYFQIQNTIGSMINDIHLMLTADESTDRLTYLFKLK